MNPLPRILIVDDNEDIHHDFRLILQQDKRPTALDQLEQELFDEPPLAPQKSFGYEIDFALQGQEALAKVKRAADTQKPYALAFMDVRMPPGWNGIETISQIWKNHPDIEMVICTAYSDYSWEDLVDQLGVNDHLLFLRKPFDATGVRQIALMMTQKWQISRSLQNNLADLESRVTRRTAELKHINEQLTEEIDQRIAAEKAMVIAKKSTDALNRELEESVQCLRSTQEQLVQSEKMASLSGLVAGVAHEINTPVGNAITASSHLLGKTEKLLDRYRKQKLSKNFLESYLETTKIATELTLSNLHRAATLVKSFKELATNQWKEDKRSFPLREQLELGIVALQSNIKHLTHRVEIAGDPALTLFSHPRAIHQIVATLVDNSLVHAYEEHESGKLLFQFAALPEKPGWVRLQYSDDGRGIAAVKLEKIFDPFYTTRRGRGSIGLGLPILYNLVTQHLSGQITCHSESGSGSVFVIDLPTLANR